MNAPCEGHAECRIAMRLWNTCNMSCNIVILGYSLVFVCSISHNIVVKGKNTVSFRHYARSSQENLGKTLVQGEIKIVKEITISLAQTRTSQDKC